MRRQRCASCHICLQYAHRNMHIAICTVSISVPCTGSALTRTSNYAESYKLTQSWVSTFMHLISSRVCKFVNWGFCDHSQHASELSPAATTRELVVSSSCSGVRHVAGDRSNRVSLFCATQALHRHCMCPPRSPVTGFLHPCTALQCHQNHTSVLQRERFARFSASDTGKICHKPISVLSVLLLQC